LSLSTYHAYSRGYSGETDTDVTPPISSGYLAWTSRHYHVNDFSGPDGTPVRTPDFAVLDFVSELNSDELVFPNAKSIVPCFTLGTLIATSKGERKVEDLMVGDRVITRDTGIQEVLWIGRCDMPSEELVAKKHLRPVLIRQGALGNNLPERDMMVSPQHRVLIANDKTILYFNEPEVLISAKYLTDMEGINVVDVLHTTYIHLMFGQHEVILSDGIWTESFQPGQMSLASVGDMSRKEIFEIFPELATKTGIDSYLTARRSLKKYEAKVI
jgi:hypothetical protein